MSEEEFKELIKSIGFEYIPLYHRYEYKEFSIDICLGNVYNLYTGSGWILIIPLNHLNPLNKYFKREMRSIKLKELLR